MAAPHATSSASVVVVDAKSVSEERHGKAESVLRRASEAPPSLVQRSGIAHTVPFTVTVVIRRKATTALSAAEASEGAKIDAVLKEAFAACDATLNEYRATSEVSKINQSQAGKAVPVSPWLAEVIDTAARISRSSGGAFDIATAPIATYLAELAVEHGGDLPATFSTVEQAECVRLAAFSSFNTGFDYDRQKKLITKRHPEARLFFGGISKGATVDRIAERLASAGFPDCLVDWGGDVKGCGVSHHGTPWRVGILTPPTVKELRSGDRVSFRQEASLKYLRVCTLENEAIATSGDYEHPAVGGAQSSCLVSRLYDHKTGRLLVADNHGIAQCTIKSTSCTVADGLATACLLKRDFARARWLIDSWRYCRNAVTDFTFFVRDSNVMAVMHEVARETEEMKQARIASSIPARVLVVGGGLAGCCAAIEAARCGASVVIIEKAPKLGGNSAKATSGMNGWGTTAQGNLDINDDGRFFERDTYLSGSGGTTDPGLVKTLSVKSAESVHWVMKETGLSLTTVAQLGGHSRRRTHRAPDRPDGTPVPIGFTIMQKLIQRIHQDFQGRITVMTNTAARNLLHTKREEKDGVVRIVLQGVEFEDLETKTRATLTADSVILTTGGFGNDRSTNSLLAEFAPNLTNTPTTNGDFATGDGVKMARALGVSLVDMDKVQLHPTGLIDPKQPDAATKYLGPEALRGSGGVLLNRRGKRFTNELGLRSVVSKAIQDQGDAYPGSNGSKYACCVLNAAAVKLFGPNQLSFYKDSIGVFQAAESVDALAKVIGADPKEVRETLRAYGAAAKDGRCPLTGKTVFPCVVDDESGPYVVAFVTPSIHYTMGGIAISPSTEVQIVDNTRAHGSLFGTRRPVLGLFAAGEVSAGVHGANRLGGNSLLECVVFGRIAGDRAAGVLQKSPEALSSHVWTPVVVREVREGTMFGRGSVVLRFNLPGAQQVTGLKLGQFVSIRGEWDGQQLVGYYSPITLPNEPGVIGLLARKDKGSLREWIAALRPGDAVYMKACPGISIDRIPERAQLLFEGRQIRKFGFIAGGTGIAPMLQIIRAATKHPYSANVDALRLVYAAETEEELTYEKVMREFEMSSEGKFKCNFVVNDPPAGWTKGVGFVDASVLQSSLTPPSDDLLVLICGPPVMQKAVIHTLRRLKYTTSMIRTVDDAAGTTQTPVTPKL